jgi:hypothetical protein
VFEKGHRPVAFLKHNYRDESPIDTDMFLLVYSCCQKLIVFCIEHALTHFGIQWKSRKNYGTSGPVKYYTY